MLSLGQHLPCEAFFPQPNSPIKANTDKLSVKTGFTLGPPFNALHTFSNKITRRCVTVPFRC